MTTVRQLSETENDRLYAKIKRKADEAKAAKAFQLFRAAGIEPILIKGLAAAANYPAEQFRDSIDLDLAVPHQRLDEGWKVVASPEANGLAIDLHDELRHLDTLPWTVLFSRSGEVQVEGGSIRLLAPEDHLRVLCVHWLTDGGSNYSRLNDIRFAIENRSDDFDWETVIRDVPDRWRRWLSCAIGIAGRTFDIDLKGTPFADAVDTLPAWFLRTVENEWASETKFRSLASSATDWTSFRKQLKKRFPPNPITATILMNGSLDARTRVFYQIGTTVRRAGPSIRSLTSGLLHRNK